MSPLAARLLAVALAVAAVAAVHAGPPPCSAFLQPLIPCTQYITGEGASVPVPTPCCDGMKTIAGVMTTRADRVAACNCFQDAAAKMTHIDYDRVAALPVRDRFLCRINAAVGTEAEEEHL